MTHTAVSRGFIVGAMFSLFLFMGGHAHAVIIDWVTVYDPGNPDDQDYGTGPYGGVPYYYNISKDQVSNDQYAEFLNAVDRTGANALGLYHGSMSIDFNTGAPEGLKYTSQASLGSEAVLYVSFLDCMRFVNWLENGQGSGGTESGVYTIDLGYFETRNPSASFWLPSEDEWYKAAYYQPAAHGGPSDSYWLYPNASDDPPAGALGPSYYGTQFDYLNEWNEAIIFSELAPSRGTRLGPATHLLQASFRTEGYDPSVEIGTLGFRVAGYSDAVPEPTVAVLLPLGGALVCWRRRVTRWRVTP